MEDLYRRREERKRCRIRYVKHASFRNYIRKMLGRFNEQATISSTAVEIIDSIVYDLFHQLASEAKNLMVHARKRTLSVQEVQFAAALCFRGEVARHAVSEGQRAVLMYTDLSRK